MNIIWTFWILFLIASFAAFESYALVHDKTTLSRFTWNASQAWPPLPFVAGLIAGGLAVHFWWHWCPPGSLSTGMLEPLHMIFGG